MKKYSALALLVTLGSANAFAQNNEPAAPAAEPAAPAAEPAAPAADAAPAEGDATAEGDAPAAEPAPAPIDCAKAKDECKLIAAPTEEELAAKKKADEEAKAAAEAKAEAEANAPPPMPWVALGDTEFDWVQIDTDEWLKGKVKKMRDGDFEFDSDQFGVLTFGWGDVKILHTTTRYTFVDEAKQVYTGTVEKSTDGQVKIKTDEGMKTLDSGVILSIVKETATEWAKWGLAASLGGTARAGNTESLDYTGMLRISRRDEFTRWVNQYDGSYGEVSGDPNTNKHLGVTRFDIFIAKRFYVTPFYGEARYDKFQNISLRWAAAAGGGVHVIQDGPLTLDFDATAGYQQTYFIDATVDNLDGALVAPGVTLEWDITPDIDFDAAWKSTIIVTDLDKNTNQTYHHGSARFSVALTSILDFQLSGIFDRIENPQQTPIDDPANPPATIVKNDLAVTVGLGLDLE